MKFLIIFVYLITTSFSYAIEKPNIKNLVVNQNPKIYEKIIFKDLNKKDIDLEDYRGKLLILNFWATWCAPCREEMPSLDELHSNDKFKNLMIFPINIGQEDLMKSKNFFSGLNIKNLNIYFDPTVSLAKKFLLQGIPTTVLLNKEGEEFARIIGSIDFKDKKFIEWLSNYD
tara:strand:- start:578 stop:1093 length:516 start_codon:yes stop_codon:yes gene_type:complete